MKKLGFRFLIFSAIFACLALCSSAMAQEYTEVVISNNTNYSTAVSGKSGPLHIKGSNKSIVLTLDSDITLTDDLKIDNITLSGAKTIAAAGHKLYIGENVTSDALTIYGGNIVAPNITGDTNIEIHSGTYANIYGGGKRHVYGNTNVKIYGGTITGNVYGGGLSYNVYGNTSVVFGGNAECLGSSNSDSIGYVYGGGYNGRVQGTTTVKITDEAKAKFVFGGHVGTKSSQWHTADGSYTTTTNVIVEENCEITQNVYGGNSITTGEENYWEKFTLNTNVKMTGGKVQAIFGGNSGMYLNGTTRVDLTGGEVTRRVYSGCYNDTSTSGFSLKYATDYYVDGTTTLVIGPDVDLCAGRGLDSDDDNNKGIYAGSRRADNSADEINTIVFIGDSYDEQSQYIELEDSYSAFLYSIALNSHHDYVLNCSGDDKDDYIDVVVESGELKFRFTSDNRKVTIKGKDKIIEQTLNIDENPKTVSVTASDMNSGNTPTEVIFSGEPLAKIGAINLTAVEVTLGRNSGTPIAGNELKLVIKDDVGNIIGEAKLENENASCSDGILTLGVSEGYNAFNRDFYEDTIELVLVKNGYASRSVKMNTLDFIDKPDERINAINTLGENFADGHGDIKEDYDDEAGDGVIDIEDYIRLIRGFNSASSESLKKLVDLDEDGSVGVTDLAIIKKNFGFSVNN